MARQDADAVDGGCIQAHGCLLALEPQDLSITQVSENCLYWLGQPPAQWLGLPLKAVLGEQAEVTIRGCLLREQLACNPLHVLTMEMPRAPHTLVDISAHTVDGILVLEIEPNGERADDASGELRHYRIIKRALRRLHAAASLEAFCEVVSVDMRHLTQTDRVTVYRFHPDGGSEVVGEAHRPDQSGWLGRRQASGSMLAADKDMHGQGIRSLCNAGADLCKIVPPINPVTGRPLDLRHCALRPVSMPYAAYLQSLGVSAALSMPILYGERLWGLIVCHHETPLRFSSHLRTAVLFLSQIISLKVGPMQELADRHDGLHLASGDGQEPGTAGSNQGRGAEQRGLRLSEERLRLALQISRGFFFDWDPQTDLLVHSAASAPSLGLSADEEVHLDTGRAFFRWLHPDDVAAFMDRVKALTPQAPSYTMVYVLLRHDGSQVALEECAKGIFDEQGRLTRLVGLTADVTQRHAAEQLLKRHERELQTLSDNSPDIMSRFDRELRHVFVSAAAERATGIPRADFLGKSNRELGMPDALCGQWDRALRHVLETGEDTEIEFAFPGQAGLRHYAAKLVAERDGQGNITHVLGVTRDITERRQIEQDREQLLAAEREARAGMERVGILKDEFLATVSHELRSPLGAIVGWASIVTRSHHDPAVLRQGLDAISRNARAQARLIDDLLDMSRIASGKLKMAIEPVDVNLVVASAVETLRPTAQARGIEMGMVLADPMVKVAGDADRLQQVLANLVGNALKFTPTGGHVTVRTRVADGRADIEVMDTGQGIDSGFLPHLFDRFSQADTSAARATGGLGLGLSICKHIVDLHGGTITGTSGGTGTGSTFTVQLPAMVPLGQSQASEQEADDGPSTEPGALAGQPLSGVSVLLVDDHADVLALNRRLLEEAGARVSAVTSARAALDLLMRKPVPDVLVSDIGMPGMDGYALITDIRTKLDMSPERLPAVALTAFSRDQDQQRALDAGYQAFIIKPVRALLLIRTLKDVLA